MYNDVFGLSILRNVMSERHFVQLKNHCTEQDEALMIWLLEGIGQTEQAPASVEHNKDSLEKEEIADTEDSEMLDEIIQMNLKEIEESRHLDTEDDLLDEEIEEHQKDLMDVKMQYFMAQTLCAEEQTSEKGSDWKQQKYDRDQQIEHMKLTLQQLIDSTELIQAMTKEEADGIGDVYMLQNLDRQRLYKYWIQLYRQMLEAEMFEKKMEYQLLSNQMKETRDQLDKEIMKQAKVVGMTTTAAARYHLVLQEVQPKVIVVEEAAEVLEAHVITALNRNCQHLILIGDHQQLRPNATLYRLAKDYHLDLSLFERMVNNDIPVKTLSHQHRMRPVISKLLKPIYNDLEDGDSVHHYPPIRGMMHSLFFITHNRPEDSKEELMSK